MVRISLQKVFKVSVFSAFIAFSALPVFVSCRKEVPVAVINNSGVNERIQKAFAARLESITGSRIILPGDGENVPKSSLVIVLNEGMAGKTGEKPEERIDRPGNRIIIDRKVYAPVTVFYDTETSATTEDIGAGRYRIKLLEDISLPEKALAIENLYPGDPGYPLVSETAALFEDKTVYEALAAGKRDRITETAAMILASFIEKPFFSAPERESDPETITWISFAGDIMPGRGVERILQEEDGVEKIFGDTLATLQKSDYLIGNLEGAVTEEKGKVEKSYNFKFPYHVLPRLRDAGFDYLSITNNHSFDYGEKGFLDTLSNLEKAGIATSGAGKNSTEAALPRSETINSTGINIFSLADYPAEKVFSGRKETEAQAGKPGILWPGETFFQSLEKNAGKESIDIVLVHGGFEWVSRPAAGQVEHYRKIAEKGADLVIGTHPHVLQPLEASGSSLIAWSIGNFIFPGMGEMLYAEETVILETGFAGSSLKYLNIYPVKISGRSISIDKSGRIAERFYTMNKKWNSDGR